MLKALVFLLVFTTIATPQELRRKVAILDTGIDDDFPSEYLCLEGHMDFTGLGIRDAIHHGSHIAYIIKEYMDPNKECLLILKFYDHTSKIPSRSLATAYKHLQKINISFLNMSFSGKIFSPLEKETINILLDKGVIISTAAGNNSANLDTNCIYYPTCYIFNNKNYHVVAACDTNGKTANFSNYNGPVTSCENGIRIKAGRYIFSGTSQSTGIMTGKLVEQLRKQLNQK